jgi:hypothetical protein
MSKNQPITVGYSNRVNSEGEPDCPVSVRNVSRNAQSPRMVKQVKRGRDYLSLYRLRATNVLLEISFLTSKTEKIIDRGRQPANI